MLKRKPDIHHNYNAKQLHYYNDLCGRYIYSFTAYQPWQKRCFVVIGGGTKGIPISRKHTTWQNTKTLFLGVQNCKFCLRSFLYHNRTKRFISDMYRSFCLMSFQSIFIVVIHLLCVRNAKYLKQCLFCCPHTHTT